MGKLSRIGLGHAPHGNVTSCTSTPGNSGGPDSRMCYKPDERYVTYHPGRGTTHATLFTGPRREREPKPKGA